MHLNGLTPRNSPSTKRKRERSISLVRLYRIPDVFRLNHSKANFTLLLFESIRYDPKNRSLLIIKRFHPINHIPAKLPMVYHWVGRKFNARFAFSVNGRWEMNAWIFEAVYLVSCAKANFAEYLMLFLYLIVVGAWRLLLVLLSLAYWLSYWIQLNKPSNHYLIFLE